MASKSTVTSTTNTSGTSTTAGIFAGDSAVRSVNQNILSAASLPVGTPPRSPSEIGISITKTGTMEFDEKKFSAALAADPAGTAAKVQKIATRVATAATNASDKYDGTLTQKITGQQSEVRDLANRISDWDTRLESRKATLQRTYSGLEVALSNMQAQQSWLTAQLGGLLGHELSMTTSPTVMASAVPPSERVPRRSVLSAPPARLLTMLYDRLLLDLGRARLAGSANWPVASENLLHGQAIIAELISSLKTDAWDGADGSLASTTTPSPPWSTRTSSAIRP